MQQSFITTTNILKIIDLLAGNRKYTKEEIIDRLEISERSFFRYLKFIREYGFVVNSEDGMYIIERTNNYTKNLEQLLHFSKEDSYILNESINNIDATTTAKINLINKLVALYDNDRIAVQFVTKENSAKVKPLLEAIKEKKQVKLVDYKSSGSGNITTRLVEPFEFTPNYISIWVFEPLSKLNKLFKISRMKAVEKLDIDWKFEKNHKADYLDCFRVGGKTQIQVKFKMTLKAQNLLTEEYPLSQDFITTINDNLYVFDGWISNFNGLGRFLLGLAGEFFDIEPPELIDFLEDKLKLWQNIRK